MRRIMTALFVAAVMLVPLGPSVQHAIAGQIVQTGVSVPAGTDVSAAASMPTATPIKHLVVIFQENNSFDHYFATYPHALNPGGEPSFIAAPNTPQANTLQNAGLLAPKNPNSVQPFRLTRAQALTCDQNHDYKPEQQAFDNGKMDKFVETVDKGGTGNARQFCPKGIVMGYYDGNTVTALWNYAQHYAMNDNSFGTTFGPSSPGAINLISGDIGTVMCGSTPDPAVVYNSPGACSPSTTPTNTGKLGTMTGDPDQYYDDSSSGGFGSKNTAAMAGRNVGDLLNTAGATWGWFNGGFDTNPKHPVIAYDNYMGVDPATDTLTSLTDYSAHHEAFQYYASTSNPHHLLPSSSAMIGKTDQANHQYDLTDFWSAADAGNLPAVSFLKAPRYQDGHAGYSTPLDEQQFLTETINHLQTLPSWNSTAVIISYDDSDGWYDHVVSPIVNRSSTSEDAYSECLKGTDGAPARCGYGPRLPYLVISPYARQNFIDHTLTDQTSTLRFIEDNWLNGQRISSQSFDNKAGSILNMFDFSAPRPASRLILSPVTGQPLPTNNAFEVSFTSAQPGQSMVYFGTGPGCLGLVSVATRDTGAGTTSHDIIVTGNDLPGTVGDNGLIPGKTYYYETVTLSGSTLTIDNNGGNCYAVTIPPQT